MQQIDEDRNGVPDVVERTMALDVDSQSVMSDTYSGESSASIASVSPLPSVITPDRSSQRLVWSAGPVIVLLLLVLFGLVLYIFQH